VHSGKAAVRPVVNATTGGVGGPVVSAAEDGVSVGLSLVAVFLPLLVLVVLGLLVVGFVVLLRRRRRRRTALPPARPSAGRL
jgi:heme/copper-type cytochrome/quinol oxidase subunit 2